MASQSKIVCKQYLFNAFITKNFPLGYISTCLSQIHSYFYHVLFETMSGQGD